MKTLYFTGTGNCLHVARQIGGELLSIPKLMKEEVIEIEDDAVGIVCPIYACIQNCPQHAIHLPNEQSGVRFRNENVNLQEIIEANCQQ